MSRALSPLALLLLALRACPAPADLASPDDDATAWGDDGVCDASDGECALSLRQLRAQASAAAVSHHGPPLGSSPDFQSLHERAGGAGEAQPMALVDTMSFKTGGHVLGYHQTSPEVCDLILQSEFRPGRTGWCGGAIYFADSIGGTYGEATGPDSKQGCILQAVLDLGEVKEMPATCDSTMTGAKLKAMGYDSIKFNDGAGTGTQYVLYDPKRVSHVHKLYVNEAHAKQFAAKMEAQAKLANTTAAEATAADMPALEDDAAAPDEKDTE